ncbi:Uncharacterised protein [Mycobacterium tuberculosis]|nr:Uncharacterised protein [Mycobacterium tuberculosis]
MCKIFQDKFKFILEKIKLEKNNLIYGNMPI